MATDIPILWKIALASACLSLANVIFFPQVFPDTQVTKVFFIFTGINFVLWLLFKINIYPYWFSPFRHLPKPQGGFPIIGHSYIIAQRPSGSSFLKFITEVPNDGLIKFRGPFGADWLLLSDPRSLGDVLVHNAYDFTKPTEIRNFLRLILGDGLIITEGDEHKFQRKHISPAFSFRHIKELYPIFWSKAIELSRGIDGEISENPEKSLVDEKMVNPSSVIEINHWANKVTMDIIGVAGLGRDFNTLKNSGDELIKNYEEILEPTTEKGIFFTTHLILSRRVVKLLPWRLNKILETTTGNLRNICLQLVREKKELIKTHQDENIDILSLMIKSNNFSDDALVDQLLTFLAAGHETTSSAFTWATYLLSKHPEMQQRLREEIRATVPSPSAALEPTTDLDSILESLPYLNAVCNEVLRLYPPVPVTLRVSVRPTTIQGQPIPKGTRIYISPWAINRSPHLWGPNAADFQPDRWIDADTGKANNTGGVTSNYSILTFLHGPRSCIGERFAKNEFKALMAVFCGTFDMELADPAHVPMPAGAITTKPQGGMRLRLRKVDGW